jgi:hypothetical protein
MKSALRVVRGEIPIFLVYLGAIAFIVFVDLRSPFITPEQFPNWLQAIGTFAAVGVAYKAYSTWREQDEARRKAQFGEKLVEYAFATIIAFRSTREIKHLPLNDLHCRAAIEMVNHIRPRMDDLKSFTDRLHNQVPLAVEYFDEDIRAPLSGLYQLRFAYMEALETLDLLSIENGTFGNPRDPAWDEQAIASMAVFGTHYGTAIPYQYTDEFNEKLEIFYNAIQNIVSPHITQRKRLNSSSTQGI